MAKDGQALDVANIESYFLGFYESSPEMAAKHFFERVEAADPREKWVTMFISMLPDFLFTHDETAVVLASMVADYADEDQLADMFEIITDKMGDIEPSTLPIVLKEFGKNKVASSQGVLMDRFFEEMPRILRLSPQSFAVACRVVSDAFDDEHILKFLKRGKSALALVKGVSPETAVHAVSNLVVYTGQDNENTQIQSEVLRSWLEVAHESREAHLLHKAAAKIACSLAAAKGAHIQQSPGIITQDFALVDAAQNGDECFPVIILRGEKDRRKMVVFGAGIAQPLSGFIERQECPAVQKRLTDISSAFIRQKRAPAAGCHPS